MLVAASQSRSSNALRPLAILAAAAALAGCSTLGVINAVEPKGGLTITRDVAFAPEGGGLSLDVYAPSKPSGHGRPVVVFFYGGGWDSGKKGDYAFVGKALASRGYVAVVPDYRVYPAVRWPAFLQDNARAVRWAKDHAATFGGDPNRMVLMGHSAGAYNAAMLALDPRWLGAVGMDATRDLRAVVGLAGPYDFLPLHSDELKTIFGPPSQLPDTQPINHVSGHAPPLWIATDTADKVVAPYNTTHLAAAVQAKGGIVEAHYYKGLNHALMVGVIAAPLRFLAPVFKDATAFIDAHTTDEAVRP